MDREDRLIVHTQRLVLEPVGLDDCDDLYASVVSQDSVVRWLSSGQAESRDAAVAMCRRHVAHWTQHGYGDFAVRVSTTRGFLGRVGLRNRPNFGVDLGFAISPAAEGQGFAYEAGRACLDLAFNRLQLPEVHAFALPDNVRSIALLKRLGARGSGTVVSSGRHCLRFRFDPQGDEHIA